MEWKTTIHIKDNFHDLLQSPVYEEIIYEVLKNSNVIFNGDYTHIEQEKQSHGEPDFIETIKNKKRELDAKILFSQELCKYVGINEIENFVKGLEIELNEVADCVKKPDYYNAIRRTKLYEEMLNLAKSNADKKKNGKEDIIFVFPFPISSKCEGTLAAGLGQDNIEMVSSVLLDDYKELFEGINLFLIVNNQLNETVIYYLKWDRNSRHEFMRKNYFSEYIENNIQIIG